MSHETTACPTAKTFLPFLKNLHRLIEFSNQCILRPCIRCPFWPTQKLFNICRFGKLKLHAKFFISARSWATVQLLKTLTFSSGVWYFWAWQNLQIFFHWIRISISNFLLILWTTFRLLKNLKASIWPEVFGLISFFFRKNHRTAAVYKNVKNGSVIHLCLALLMELVSAPKSCAGKNYEFRKLFQNIMHWA